jgi:hypothetical protein
MDRGDRDHRRSQASYAICCVENSRQGRGSLKSWRKAMDAACRRAIAHKAKYKTKPHATAIHTNQIAILPNLGTFP